MLPARGTIGYLSDTGGIGQDPRALYLTQYFLAPVVVAADAGHRLVVANFASRASIATFGSQRSDGGTRLFERCGSASQGAAMTALWIGVLPAAIGFLLVRGLGSGVRRYCLHDLFRLILGVGIGIGLCSECYFVGLVAGCFVLLPEILLLSAVGIGVILHRRNAGCCFCKAAPPPRRIPRLTWMLAGALGLLLLLDLAVFAWVSVRTPHGGSDEEVIALLHGAAPRRE